MPCAALFASLFSYFQSASRDSNHGGIPAFNKDLSISEVDRTL